MISKYVAFSVTGGAVVRLASTRGYWNEQGARYVDLVQRIGNR